MGDFADDALMNAENDWFGANDDRLSREERYDRGYCDEMGFDYHPGKVVFQRTHFTFRITQNIKPSGAGKCPKCNCDTVLKEGKFGKFYGCVKFPSCKGSRNL